MAKINLLTIHYGRCYGAVMQTYATCKLLEQAGHQVTVINLINPICKKIEFSLSLIPRLINEYKFWRFKHQYFSKLTSKSYSLDKRSIPDADYFVVGSDQVWNRKITNDLAEVYYLNFVENRKKIAFCSSFGTQLWAEDSSFTSKVKSFLDDFDFITVREDSAVNILSEVFQKKSLRLLDPTLEWGKFDSLITRHKPNNQLFPFLFLSSSDRTEMLEFIAKKWYLKLYSQTKFKIIFQSGPIDWLNNIYNSALVVTDSFHGLALSILYHKQFIVLCADKNKFTRLQSLLHVLQLESRYVSSKADLFNRIDELRVPIDYEKVESILRKEREKCSNFILNAFK